MGYYVQIVDSTARIPAANLQRAWQKMCALDVTHDEQKRGGSWEGGRCTGKWFSWMPADYVLSCPTAESILNELGFGTRVEDNGDLSITSYDSKMGQEDLFLEAIKTDVTGTIEWAGEDHERWTTEFLGDLVIDAEPATRLLPGVA